MRVVKHSIPTLQHKQMMGLTRIIPHTSYTGPGDLMNDFYRHFDWNFFTGSTFRGRCLKVLKEAYTVHLSILKRIFGKIAGNMLKYEMFEK